MIETRALIASRTLILCLLLLHFVVGCGGGGGGGSSTPAPAPAVPAVTGVSKTQIPIGTTFVVTGSNLNLVSSWAMGSTALPASNVSSGAVTLRVPNSASSGVLRYVDANANNVATPHSLQVYVPISVSQLSPTAPVIGQPVTLTGTGLDAVTSVLPSNASVVDAPAAITAQSPTSLTFTIPVYAESGPLSLTSAFESNVITSQSLSITPRIWFGWLTRQFSGASLNIILQGANLDQVSGATVGGVQATLSAQSASSVTLTVPRDTRGAIVLNSNNQPSRAGGSIDTVIGGSTAFFGISFGQVLDEEADNPQLRLTPSKPASVRAFISGSASGMASPIVTLTATNGTTALGTKTMTGPAVLPTSISRYDATQSFNAVLPAAWISPGLSVAISYVPTGSSTALVISEQPLIGNSTSLDLVVVPVTVGNVTGTVRTTPFPIRELVSMAFPYPYSNVSVRTRVPYTVTGLSNILSPNDILSVLAQLETLRTVENPNSIYYGLVSDAALQAQFSSGGRIAGAGWINDPDNPRTTWRLSAFGTDSANNPGFQDSLGITWAQWQKTMIHELGHVHSRHHAPCGGPAEPDPNFPYSAGRIGPQPIYSSFYISDTALGLTGSSTIFGSSTAMADVMSYCAGTWFSDYNYYYVQRFAEKYSGAGTIASAGVVSGISIIGEESVFTVLSGDITSNGVTLRPALLSPNVVGDANSPYSGYEILVKSLDGKEFRQNLTPYRTSESPGSATFSVSLPLRTSVSEAQIRRYGLSLPITNVTTSTPPNAGAVSWHRDAGGLFIKWDSVAEPYLSAFAIHEDGSRRVITLFATGGEISVPQADFEGAGVEIQLSTHLNVRKVRLIGP